MKRHHAVTCSRLLLVGSLALPLSLASCTGFEPALIGAAISGAQTGVTLLSGTEVWSFEITDFDELVEAVKITEETLALRRLNEIHEEDRYWAYYRFGKSSRLIIEVQKQTETITSIKAELDDKDQRGMATLFMRNVFEQVKKKGEFGF